MRNLKWILAFVVVTLVAAGLWWHLARGVEADLLAEAPYRILKRHERTDYARILDAWREFKSGRREKAEFVRQSNAVFSQVATRRLGAASQEAVQALMQDTIRTVRKLQAHSPEACFQYFYPEVSGAPDLTGIIGADEQRRTLELMGEVVRTAAENPAARPAQEEIEGPLADIVNATYEEYGTDAQMVAHPEDPRIDRARVCEITLALYERILALPVDVSTKLLRYMAPGAAAG